jgi:hypothetical protein
VRRAFGAKQAGDAPYIVASPGQSEPFDFSGDMRIA